MQYKRKPYTVDAVQFDDSEDVREGILLWVRAYSVSITLVEKGQDHSMRTLDEYPSQPEEVDPEAPPFMVLRDNHGEQRLDIGDYLVRDWDGSFRVVGENRFYWEFSDIDEELSDESEPEPSGLVSSTDREIARQLRALGKTGSDRPPLICTCKPDIRHFQGKPSVGLEYRYDCPVHFPETSELIR